MEPSDIQELYDYNHEVRQNYIDTNAQGALLTESIDQLADH
jgi:hypothetical protein